MSLKLKRNPEILWTEKQVECIVFSPDVPTNQLDSLLWPQFRHMWNEAVEWEEGLALFPWSPTPALRRMATGEAGGHDTLHPNLIKNSHPFKQNWIASCLKSLLIILLCEFDMDTFVVQPVFLLALRSRSLKPKDVLTRNTMLSQWPVMFFTPYKRSPSFFCFFIH